MPLKLLNQHEFLDDPNGRTYDIDDVVKVAPLAAQRAPFNVAHYYYEVCYGELCAYPARNCDASPAWCWDISRARWTKI